MSEPNWITEWDYRVNGPHLTLIRRQYLGGERPGPWKDVALISDRLWADTILDRLRSGESR